MLDVAIKRLRQDLLHFGKEVETQNWQGITNPPAFLEILNASFEAKMPDNIRDLTIQCRPLVPWAEVHFDERVSGLPLNPPPSYAQWFKDAGESLESNGKFSHSYPERMSTNLFKLVELFKRDPTTRQGFLPIWFEGDGLMALQNRRVPCTLGWHFILRDGQLNCYYPMRSCDAIRHLHHDVYFAARLTMWLIEHANLKVVPGNLNFHAVSLHVFANDRYALGKVVR